MPTDDTAHENTASDRDRERRVQALRDLASREAIDELESASTDALTRTPQNVRSTAPHRRRAIYLGTSALAFIALAAGIFSWMPRNGHKSHMTAQTPQSFVPSDEQIACEQDVAWSPGADKYALMGYVRHCPSPNPSSYDYVPGLIVVYSAKDAKPVSTLHPDQMIAAALHLLPPQGVVTPAPGIGADAISQQVIQYTHIVWSKNGTQLAASFVTNLWSPTSSSSSSGGFTTQVTYGLLLVSPQSGQTRVLSHKLTDGEIYSGRWNVAAGTYIPLSAQESASASSPLGWPPTALAYSWSANGALMPQTPLTTGDISPTTTVGSIGSPQGDQTFSVWQPGTLDTQPGDPTAATPSSVPGIYQFSTLFAAWSPDGSYFQEFNQGGWIKTGQPAAPSVDQLRSQHIQPEPLLPVRDRGLSQAISDLTQGGAVVDSLPVSLAWRPDGHLLAVASVKRNSDGSVDTSTYVVSLYNTTTGQRVSVLKPSLGAASAQEQFSFLRWSADGTHLIFADGNLAAVTIWKSGLLPSS